MFLRMPLACNRIYKILSKCISWCKFSLVVKANQIMSMIERVSKIQNLVQDAASSLIMHCGRSSLRSIIWPNIIHWVYTFALVHLLCKDKGWINIICNNIWEIRVITRFQMLWSIISIHILNTSIYLHK